jgi:AcrR family transcriptional regulator
MAIVGYDPTFRPPKQQRSKETVQRILKAAESCIRDQGFDALRIPEVARQAGSAVATVYSRFPDRMALLRGVQQSLHARIEPAFLAYLALEKERGESLKDEAERVFAHLFRHFLSERELFSASMTQAVFDPMLKAHGEEANCARRDAVSAALLLHRDEIRQPDPALAVKVAYDTCLAVIKSLLIWGSGPHIAGPLSEEVFVQELTSMLTSYLVGDRSL